MGHQPAATALAAARCLAGAAWGGPAAPPPEPTGSKTFSVWGAVIIDDPAAHTGTAQGSNGDECSGRGQADGVRPGAPVLVSGEDGEELGRSRLAAGTVT